MSNIQTVCTVILTAYITTLTTLTYSVVGTMPIVDGPFEIGFVFQILGMMIIPAILGIFIGVEIGEESQ